MKSLLIIIWRLFSLDVRGDQLLVWWNSSSLWDCYLLGFCLHSFLSFGLRKIGCCLILTFTLLFIRFRLGLIFISFFISFVGLYFSVVSIFRLVCLLGRRVVFGNFWSNVLWFLSLLLQLIKLLFGICGLYLELFRFLLGFFNLFFLQRNFLILFKLSYQVLFFLDLSSLTLTL